VDVAGGFLPLWGIWSAVGQVSVVRVEWGVLDRGYVGRGRQIRPALSLCPPSLGTSDRDGQLCILEWAFLYSDHRHFSHS
jgi:hypothetical protein